MLDLLFALSILLLGFFLIPILFKLMEIYMKVIDDYFLRFSEKRKKKLKR